jgi:glycosyltransferase involved in cell wall biosynthesis
MRIAFLTHEPFYPPTGGGSAEGIYLVREMVKRKWEVTVFCPKIENQEQVELDFGIKVIPFNTWQMGRYAQFRNGKYLVFPFFLERLVLKEHIKEPFDLFFSQHAIAAVTAGRLKQSTGVCTVMNFLDYLTGFMETWPVWAMPKPALRRLMNFELALPQKYKVDAVLTVSDTLKEKFQEAGYSGKKILPIYYGFDHQLFQLRARQPISSASPVVVMHGSFDKHHLGQIAEIAMLSVASKIPQVRFRFVGKNTGAVSHLFDQVKKSNPGIQLENTNFVPYHEVPKLLGDASVGMVPYEESTGTNCAFVAKMVEYAALGIPVASTPVASVKKYFKNTPLIRFSEFEGESLAAEICHWLAIPAKEIEPLAREAAAKVHEELAWEVIARKAMDFTEETFRAAKR